MPSVCRALFVLTVSASAFAQQWILRQPANSPSPRVGAAMVFDAARAQTLLFGGSARYAVPWPATFGDTWTFDGTDWTLRAPAARPPNRVFHAMTFDARRNVVVLFGGVDGNGSPLNDTWEWNGATWATRHQSTVPAARGWASLAYDGNNEGVWLYGGYDPTSQTHYGDVWRWSGLDQAGPLWVHSGSGPSPRRSAGMVATYQGLLVHGGSDAARPVIGETWRRDATTLVWSQVATGPACTDAALVNDGRSGFAFLCGGRTASGVASDLWRFHGTTWWNITPATEPTAAVGAAGAVDTARNRIVRFGGGVGAQLAGIDELWEYDSPFPATPFGTACAATGTPPQLVPVSAPALGTTMYFQVYRPQDYDVGIFVVGFDDAQWNGVPLPIDLAVLGLPGCSGYLAPEMTAFIPASLSGIAYAYLGIPAAAHLIGAEFFAQAVIADDGAFAGSTGALRCVVY